MVSGFSYSRLALYLPHNSEGAVSDLDILGTSCHCGEEGLRGGEDGLILIGLRSNHSDHSHGRSHSEWDRKFCQTRTASLSDSGSLSASLRQSSLKAHTFRQGGRCLSLCYWTLSGRGATRRRVNPARQNRHVRLGPSIVGLLAGQQNFCDNNHSYVNCLCTSGLLIKRFLLCFAFVIALKAILFPTNNKRRLKILIKRS